MPSAVKSGMEFQFLIKLLDRTKLDAKQLRDIEKWAVAKRKAA